MFLRRVAMFVYRLPMKWNSKELQRRMKRAALNETQVAAEVGVTSQSVKNWLNGRQPRAEHAAMLARVLNCTVAELCKGRR